MDATSTSFDLLRELESRHDELLVRLDELDKRVEKTLIECQALRVVSPSCADPSVPIC